MNAPIASALLLLPLTAVTAAAQQVISERVAMSMPARYEQPACELKSGHFKVSSGATYLKTGIDTDIPENKARVWGNGRKVLIEAIQQNGQAQNPAAWYYLGRIYLQEGDLPGADSALRRAEKGAPQCAQDIQNYRRNAWVSLIQAGQKFEEEQNPDSAAAMYRQANMVYQRSGIGYYQLASLLNEQGQPDSAAAYFGLAVTGAEGSKDTTEMRIRSRSAFNQGAILLNAQQFDKAVPALERYLQLEPNDAEAKRGLASAYRALGQTDKAQALEQQLVAAGASPGATGGAGAADLMNVGVNLYNDKKYAEAAEAFSKVAEAEPYNRDALYSLANSYLALKDGPKLVAAAERLAAIEPLNETALKLVGEGHKQSGKVDNAVKAAEKVLALPVDVKVTDFTPSAAGAALTATATGRAAQTPAGKPIAPVPLTMTVEFLDAKGGVVATADAAVPALPANATHEIKVSGQGSGITAWRYQRK